MELVIFRINGQPYGMKIDFLEGIEAASDVTPVANAPANIIGICNIRGEIVPIFDIAARFGVECKAVRPQYLLIRINGEPICFKVDSVDGMREYEDKEFLKVPSIVLGTNTKYLSSAVKIENGELALVIKPDKVISSIEQQSIVDFVANMN